MINNQGKSDAGKLFDVFNSFNGLLYDGPFKSLDAAAAVGHAANIAAGRSIYVAKVRS
jgi:hypothetical protein